MARALRIERAGGRYHVMARGNERKVIFRDERDYFHFLELLSQLSQRFGARVHAYALNSELGARQIGSRRFARRTGARPHRGFGGRTSESAARVSVEFVPWVRWLQRAVGLGVARAAGALGKDLSGGRLFSPENAYTPFNCVPRQSLRSDDASLPLGYLPQFFLEPPHGFSFDKGINPDEQCSLFLLSRAGFDPKAGGKFGLLIL
jgi:hypothetical protein